MGKLFVGDCAVVIIIWRTDLDSDCSRSPDVDDGVKDLEGKPAAVLDRSAVRVGASICMRAEEVVQEVAT